MELISSHILERLDIATHIISIAVTVIIDTIIDKVLDLLSMR